MESPDKKTRELILALQGRLPPPTPMQVLASPHGMCTFIAQHTGLALERVVDVALVPECLATYKIMAGVGSRWRGFRIMAR